MILEWIGDVLLLLVVVPVVDLPVARSARRGQLDCAER